jgi:hypothetical protein
MAIVMMLPLEREIRSPLLMHFGFGWQLHLAMDIPLNSRQANPPASHTRKRSASLRKRLNLSCSATERRIRN